VPCVFISPPLIYLHHYTIPPTSSTTPTHKPLPQNALHGAYVFSTKALAKIAAIDTAPALQVLRPSSNQQYQTTANSKNRSTKPATHRNHINERMNQSINQPPQPTNKPPSHHQVPGVVEVATARDITGKNDLSMGAGDELLLVRPSVPSFFHVSFTTHAPDI
jgi:hypothetical protein